VANALASSSSRDLSAVMALPYTLTLLGRERGSRVPLGASQPTTRLARQ
jgi:hypothetical protein